jgi:hypothetical protein
VTGARRAASEVWEFVVGDDWLTAAGVVVALGLTALVSEESAGWFVLPLAVAILLPLSIWREARKRDASRAYPIGTPDYDGSS